MTQITCRNLTIGYGSRIILKHHLILLLMRGIICASSEKTALESLL